MRAARRGSRFAFHAALFALIVAASLNSFSAPVRAVTGGADTKGTEFWLTFNQNFDPAQDASFPLSLTLFITADTNTSGVVSIPGLVPAVSIPFTVTAGLVTSVPITADAQLTTNGVVEHKGIHVTADNEVTVYGLNRRPTSTDALLGLPVDILGHEYITLGYGNSSTLNAANETEFSIVGTQDATTVTINPSALSGSLAGQGPRIVTLNAGDTYQLRNGEVFADLSGSIITADHPVAVFGGHSCADVVFPACDHLVEQLTPTTTWGRNFVTMPLATRLDGDTFRFLAQHDGTDVSVNGVLVATLNRGELFEQIIAGAANIVSDEPILVAQYSNGSFYDGVTSDPFMVLVPPHEQFQASYTVTTPASGFSLNFLNVVVPATAVASVRLDGLALTPADIVGGVFTAIGTSGFSGAQLIVTHLGSHSLSAALPFGITVYGFDEFDSYGYPGGMSLAPVATVNTLSLSPETAVNPLNTQHCVTATVTDSLGGFVAGVRVDFSVAGSHTVLGFSNTDAQGQAPFCYLGTIPGVDTITASQGNLTDTASKTWQTAAPIATTLELTPKTAVNLLGAQHCVTAELTDQFDDPVPNTRIDFSVTGVHTASGSSNTDAEGIASFCYVGTIVGMDTITAKQGALTDSGTKTWQAPPPPPSECVRDEGDWRDAKTPWPVSSLTLGTVTYTKSQLLSILGYAARPDVRSKNGLVVLAADLIAAKLNRAKGAAVPASVAAAIAAADALIGSKVVPPVGAGSLTVASVNSVDCTLTLYNSGTLRGGPRACKDCVTPPKDDDHDKGDHDRPRGRPGKKPHPRPEPVHHDGDRCIPGLHGHHGGDYCFGQHNTHHAGDGCDGTDFRHTVALRNAKGAKR